MLVYGLTLDHSNNYGSNFQAYALKRVIENCTISGEKCEYRIIPIRGFREWIWPERLIASKQKSLSRSQKIRRAGYFYHRLQFRRFEKKYFHYANVKSVEMLSSLNEDADAFVCGSDVIWRPEFNYHLDSFFLDFAHKYKFSYAASFGKADVDDRTIEQIRQFLPSFNAVSCREKSGSETVEKYTGRKADVVLDPVLLLSRNEWDQLAGRKSSPGKYIFVYLTHITKPVMDFIEALKRRTGLKVVFSSWGIKQTTQLKMIQVHRPEKWLRLLRDAEYVVTNSFHGTAFCVIFHKKFFTVIQEEKGKGASVRMNDFLTMVGLDNRLYSSVPESLDLDDFSFQHADRVLAEKREESSAFLKKNLEAAYTEKQINKKARP